MEKWVTAHESPVHFMEADKSDDTLKQEPRFEHVDPCAANPSSPTSCCSVYYSARALSMIKDKNKYNSELEFKIEHSKTHWSQLADTDDDDDTDNSIEANLEHFQRLKSDVHRWGKFFKDFESLVVGEKIAEGGQAEIYAATLFGCYECVVKMFKEGFALQDLQRQWPEGMMKSHTEITSQNISELSDIFHSAIYKDRKGYSKLECLHGGTLLRDERFKNRFAFVMKRQWGDLRTVIDTQMMERKNHGPPFSKATAERLILNIARDMRNLHQRNGIIHRDLKASNVLVPCSHETNGFGSVITVTDFECSIGVVGTAFWRAPEVLQQLKDNIPLKRVRFSYTTDVYSFGMTCYEIVTGCIPFGDHLVKEYDVVLNGGRPELPHDLEPWLKRIVEDCWHPNPLQRPYFCDLVDRIEWEIRDSERKRGRTTLIETGEVEIERIERINRIRRIEEKKKERRL